MENTKGILIGGGVTALLVGLLFGTGVIRVGGQATEEEASEEESAEVAPPQGQRRRRKGRKGRRRRKGKAGQLDSLAYLGEIPLTDETRNKSGVTIHDPSASDGLFLANIAGGGNTGRRRRTQRVREAVLWDASGKKLNTWSSSALSAHRSWAMTRLDDDGYLYVVVADRGLLKLDWASNEVWSVRGRLHHDFTLLDDGRVAVLAERRIVADAPEALGEDASVRLLDHGVVFLDEDGTVMEEVWLYESFKDHPTFQDRFLRGVEAKKDRVLVEEGDAERPGGLDTFHANSIVILPRDIEGLGKAGDLLLSFRHMSTVACVSHTTKEVLWSWGSDDLVRQHDATPTADGKVVLFDNRTKEDLSRVVVVDPKTNAIVRTIGGRQAKPELQFFSMGRGLAQELDNGNIMVVVSNEGRAFEVTANDDIVWEFWSPWMGKDVRRPFRGVRIEGAHQERIQAIVSGSVPQPVVPEGYQPHHADLGASGVDDDDEDEESGASDDELAPDEEPEKPQPETKPTGQDTPVPPSPQ